MNDHVGSPANVSLNVVGVLSAIRKLGNITRNLKSAVYYRLGAIGGKYDPSHGLSITFSLRRFSP